MKSQTGSMNKDSSKRRYKLLDQLGAGSFATVYAARDVKLSREVAIKQLHQQYLQDKDQLDRYWQEAQLMGSLEHPNIMTIFDVVKSKGCLVLERMQGSLKQIYEHKPMPVEEVRQTVVQAVKGLDCLHQNGMIHGDVKPGNLFLSKQSVVKLGDFGLARRVADEDGSLVKGTTRYMAPELVSEEFGDVGPASDLYSLGFSALELLVGPQFDSLFPDLIAFGRDRQMAWMMWHCSADRKLPPVQNILSGVPDDLAKVLEKLTSKDQANRYQTAQQVLDDLSGRATPVGQSLKDDEIAAAELAAAKKARMRKWAAIAGVFSILISGLIIWLTQEKVEPPAWVEPAPVRGVVENVLPIDNKLVLTVGQDFKEFDLIPRDEIVLNRKQRQLRDLVPGDRVVVFTRLVEENKEKFEFQVFRPESHAGVVKQVLPEEKQFIFQVTEGDDADQEFTLNVPDGTSVRLNSNLDDNGMVYDVTSLQEGDRVDVDLSDDVDGMVALKIVALRDNMLSGFIRKMETRSRIVTVALSQDEDDDEFVRIPLAPGCEITLNGLPSINDELVKFSDLMPGDKVTLSHDVRVKTMDAYRVFFDEGAISNLNLSNGIFQLETENGVRSFKVDPKCDMQLLNETVALRDLRIGDYVKISHDSPGDTMPMVDTFEATRPDNKSKWAILIGNGEFKDGSIPPLNSAVSSMSLIKDRLIQRYGVPTDQTFVCEDFENVRLLQEVPKWINQVPDGAELYVYVNTRAYSVPNKTIYFASKDTVLGDIDKSQLTLEWLVDLLDGCRTRQKLLMLDCTPPDASSNSQQVTGEEMIKVIRGNHRGGYPQAVYVLTSCQKGQAARLKSGTGNVSLFASTIAEGFAGKADTGRDNQLEITELAEHVVKTMANESSGQQTSLLVLPDASPPRISARAKTAIVDLLGRFNERKLIQEQLESEARSAEALSGGEPEAMLAYGILLIKMNKIPGAQEVIEKVRLNHPGSVEAQRAAIWINFYKMRYDDGFSKFSSLLDQVPTPSEMDEPYKERTIQMFEWLGRLREIAANANWTERVPKSEDIDAMDRRVAEYGDSFVAKYNAGRQYAKKILDDFQQQIDADPNSDATRKINRLRFYMDSFANEETIAAIIEGLDK